MIRKDEIVMDIKIIYFSGTGNTQLITHKIVESFKSRNKGVDIYKVEEVINNKLSLDNIDGDTFLGIGFPVYDLMAPKIIYDFVNKMPTAKTPVPVFIYSTMAFIKGDCHSLISQALKQKGYYTINEKGFLCPSNGIFVYENPDHNRYKFVRFEDSIPVKIDKFVSKTLDMYSIFNRKTFSVKLFINPVYKIFRFFSGKLFGEKYYKNLSILSSCTNCRKCLVTCPQDNIIFTNGRVEVKESNCTLRCLRCVCSCKQNAITFTSSDFKKRYTQSSRDYLYSKVTTK